MRKKVLIVDDEAIVTLSLSDYLSVDHELYEVKTTNNGETALSLLDTQSFDVVVLDIKLPGVNGLDLLLKIKQKEPSTKVIMITAYGSLAIKTKAMAHGSLFFLDKPFEPEELRHLIREALCQKKTEGFADITTASHLIDLLQISHLSSATTMLSIKKGQKEGSIYFENGQIVHASAENIEGEEAFFSILAWPSGSFRFVDQQKPPKHTIRTSYNDLLREGIKRVFSSGN